MLDCLNFVDISINFYLCATQAKSIATYSYSRPYVCIYFSPDVAEKWGDDNDEQVQLSEQKKNDVNGRRKPIKGR